MIGKDSSLSYISAVLFFISGLLITAGCGKLQHRAQAEKIFINGYILTAYSGFEEKIKGKILPRMLSDFIVLSDDILTIPPQKLLSLQVKQSYIGRNLVYDKGYEDE